MSLFRSVFAALLVSALVALVSGQCATPIVERCQEVEMTTNSGVTLSLVLTYDNNNGVNEICSIILGSAVGTNVPATAAAGYSITLVPRTAAGQNVITPISATNPDLLSINLQFLGTPASGSTSATTYTGTLTSTNINSGADTVLNFPAPGFTTGVNGDPTGAARTNDCTAIRGDPLFSGFKGQQFYVAGEDGQVMNMISTFNMQLNGRFVTLQEGEALFPYQQDKLRLESEIAHQAEPSVAAFPKTTAWSHPGNYIGEAGVALLGDNRVYAKAGSFATGFSKLTLNGRNMPVSDDFVVLGSGVNTTFVQRVSAHEVMVRTVNLEFTITNSDNFLNVEHIHMERGARQYNHFDGLLGKTTDSKWSYSPAEEQAAVVQSNNLFERTAVQA